MIAQIVLTLALTQLLAEKISYVYFILELAGAVVAIWVYLRPGSPSYKLVWMCLLLALPVSGMILFWLWVVRIRPKSQPASGASGPSARELADVQRGESLPPAAAVRHLGFGLQLICRKKAFYSIETRKPSILAMASPFLMI